MMFCRIPGVIRELEIFCWQNGMILRTQSRNGLPLNLKLGHYAKSLCPFDVNRQQWKSKAYESNCLGLIHRSILKVSLSWKMIEFNFKQLLKTIKHLCGHLKVKHLMRSGYLEKVNHIQNFCIWKI